MNMIGKVLFGVLLFLLLWTAAASAAWVNVPYYGSYPYAVPYTYAGAPYYYSYSPYAYRVPAPVPVYMPAVTYVPRPVLYAPSVPAYSYSPVGYPWTSWAY